jgi:hypothetical protein
MRPKISQPVKLYPPGQPVHIPQDTETPVVTEIYDEVVFTNPTETFFQQLNSIRSVPTVTYSQQAHFPKYSDTEDMKALLEAQKFLKNELELAKERFMLVDEELAKVDEALRQQLDQRKKAAVANANKKISPVPAAARPKVPPSSRPGSTGAATKPPANKKLKSS